MRQTLLVLLIVAGLAVLAARIPPGAPAERRPGAVSQEHTGGFRYEAAKSGPGDFLYSQLWYFNFLDDRGDDDPSNDVAGVGAYGVNNPEGLLVGPGLTTAFGMINRPAAEGGSFNLFAPNLPPGGAGEFMASPTFEPGPGPELRNVYGTIDVVSADEYHVVGKVGDAERGFAWDLVYRRRMAPPWRPWVRWPLPRVAGLLPTWIDYYEHMGDALVDGTYRVFEDGRESVYALEGAKGYHDGFTGKLVFSVLSWDWVDYKQDDLSVELLNAREPIYSCIDWAEREWVRVCTPGNLRVVHEGRSYDFLRPEISIVYDATAHDDELGVDYPSEETITAQDADGNRLHLHWSLVRTLKVHYDVPAPFDDTVTFENVARFEGEFRPADGEVRPIRGSGWSNWSGRVSAKPGSD